MLGHQIDIEELSNNWLPQILHFQHIFCIVTAPINHNKINELIIITEIRKWIIVRQTCHVNKTDWVKGRVKNKNMIEC